MAFRLACSGITWGREADREQVLEQIARAGYEGAVAGGRQAQTAQEIVAQLGRYGLKPAPGYLGAPFYDPERREEIMARARAQAELSSALGCTELFVAVDGSPQRWATAGHVTANRTDGLTEEQFRRMCDVLNEVGRICLDHGVKACFHNHAGTYVETCDEYERLCAWTDPSLVFLGPDTGHLRFGGDRGVDFYARHAERIKCMHLKDVNEAVLEEGRRQGWSYREMVEHGIWTEPGEGCIDFPAIFDILRRAGYDGWLIVEVDRTPKPTPWDSITASMRYLRSLGL